MNSYEKYRKKIQKEVNEFPMFYAFSEKQFNDGMAKVGLRPGVKADIKKVCNGPVSGSFMKKDDTQKFVEMAIRHKKEMIRLLEEDTDGTGFIFEMFYYELNNHEYCITRDETETLDALGLDAEELDKNEKLKNGLNLAIEKIIKEEMERCYE